MPYPNEHAARLQDPKKFDPKAYRRSNGGTIYGKIKVPVTIAIIWGKLKGKAKPSDKPIPQSLRFPTKSWTADKAKKWLKDNNIKYILFEPAKPIKQKQAGMAETKYNCECIKCGYKQTSTKHCNDLKCPKCGGQMRRVERPGPGQDKNTAPLNACVFDEGCEVSFAEAGDEQQAGRFRIVAYSGGIIPNHWLWGNIAIDLAGLKFEKKKTAVLEEHFSANRIGFTTKQEIADQVAIEGKFLSNPKAQEIRNDLKDGFPMQASIYVPPALIEHVREGEYAEVNGRKLKGPGTVLRKAIIREVSMCALGADSHTQSKTFADGKQEIQFSVLERENIMDEQTKIELTAETFAVEYPDVFEEVTADAKAEGEKAAMERFSQISGLAKDDPAFVVEQFTGGKTVVEAQAALIERLRSQKDEAVEAAKTAAKKVDPAEQEFSDEQQPDKDKDADGKPKTWDAALKQQMKETKCSEADAVRFCVGEYPELHEKMLEEQKSR